MNILYVLSKELNISYENMNNMPFFEILTVLDVYQENVKEENKRNEQENARMNKQMSSMQQQYNYNNIAKQQQQQYNNITMPNFNMPKI